MIEAGWYWVVRGAGYRPYIVEVEVDDGEAVVVGKSGLDEGEYHRVREPDTK